LRGLKAPHLLYMSVQEQLRGIVEEVLNEHPGIFLVEFNSNNQNYEIVLDGDHALGIYDISDISRSINHKADEMMPEESYSLDVTSPGADSDIKLLRQYPKHVNREFSVKLKNEETFTGKLLAVEGEELSFDKVVKIKPKKTEEIKISFQNIQQANIILSFK
jgi:ribosome maturation factor RimP